MTIFDMYFSINVLSTLRVKSESEVKAMHVNVKPILNRDGKPDASFREVEELITCLMMMMMMMIREEEGK